MEVSQHRLWEEAQDNTFVAEDFVLLEMGQLFRGLEMISYHIPNGDRCEGF